MSDPVPRAELEGAFCLDCELRIPEEDLDYLAANSDSFFCQGCGGRSYRLASGMNMTHFDD